MRLETERLILRPWEETDAKALYEIAKDPKVGPAAGWKPHQSVEESLNIIKNILAKNDNYAILEKEDRKLIGSIGLFQTKHCSDDEMEIGFWLGSDYWGKGYIPEAVYELQRHAFLDKGLAGMWAAYFDGNEKSRRVQEKCGFEYRFSEYNNTNNQLGEAKTVHFTYISKDKWKKKEEK